MAAIPEERLPGGGDPSDPEPTPARSRLARALRDLIEVTLNAPAAEPALDHAAQTVEAMTAELEGAVPLERARTLEGHDSYLVRSPLVGAESPIAPPFEWTVENGRVRAVGVFRSAYEGPPGYVHGGWVALAFDEVLGMTNIVNGHPGMTGTLKVRYLLPTPLYTELEIEGWTERVAGRRIVAHGRLRAGEVVVAEAEGLFVTIDPELAEKYFST